MNLQTLINAQSSNSKLDLPPGESFGQVVIDRPITIVGRGKSTWIGSRQSPAIRITAAGVMLRELMVEVTSGDDGVAVEADPGTNPVLVDVVVVGALIGVSVEKSVPITFLPPPPISAGPDIVSPAQSPPNAPVPERVAPEPTHKPSPATPAPRARTSRASSRPAPAPPTSKPSSWWSPGVILLIALNLMIGSVALLLYLDRRTTAPEIERRQQDKVADLTRQLEQARDQASARLKELEREKDLNLAKVKDLEQQRDRAQADLQAVRGRTPDQLQEPRAVREARSGLELVRLAEQGNAEAQYQVGVYYRGGLRIPGFDFAGNHEEAVKWFQKAAQQGHRTAQEYLRQIRKPWLPLAGRGVRCEVQ